MAGRDLWHEVAASAVDVALVQEARPPGGHEVLECLPPAHSAWRTAGWPPRDFRTAVAPLSDRVQLRERPNVAVEQATSQADWTVERSGTLTAADLLVDGRTSLPAVSVYAPWDRTTTGGLYADAAAHRVLSDLSALMFTRRHRLLVAGDWNILFGYGEHGDGYYAARYRTVFDRAAALGLRFLGPQAPGGREAEPWPVELPRDSLNVPTYHHSRQTPQTATRQLDFVFASDSLAEQVTVTALNQPTHWGSSDHCKLLIEVAT